MDPTNWDVTRLPLPEVWIHAQAGTGEAPGLALAPLGDGRVAARVPLEVAVGDGEVEVQIVPKHTGFARH